MKRRVRKGREGEREEGERHGALACGALACIIMFVLFNFHWLYWIPVGPSIRHRSLVFQGRLGVKQFTSQSVMLTATREHCCPAEWEVPGEVGVTPVVAPHLQGEWRAARRGTRGKQEG